MRKLILALDGRRGARVAGPAGAATKGDQHLRVGLLAEVGHDHRRRHRHLDEPRLDGEPPGPRDEGRVRLADPEAGEELLVHVHGCRDVHLQGRAAPEADRHDHRQGAAADRHARRLGADRHGGDKVTLSGVVSNHKAGETVTIYYQPYPQPNLIQRATVLTADGRHFSFIVAPRDADHLPGRLEGRVRDADHRAGAAAACRSAATTAGSSTPRRPARSPAARCSSSA